MVRVTSGTEYTRNALNAIGTPGLDEHHSGLYAEAVAKLNQVWRTGIRYDLLTQNNVVLGGTDQRMPANLPRYSAMLEYSPTEFSRLRLQFAQDRSRQGLADNQIFLQYIMSLGAHGAHQF